MTFLAPFIAGFVSGGLPILIVTIMLLVHPSLSALLGSDE